MRSLQSIRFAATNIDPKSERAAKVEDFGNVVKDLKEDDPLREDFMKACLRKLGLKVVEEVKGIPKLSKLHLSSWKPSDVGSILENLEEIITQDRGDKWIKDQHDNFRINNVETLSMDGLEEALTDGSEGDKITDYDAITKDVIVHTDSYPTKTETPYFNHDIYYDALETYHTKSTRITDLAFGRNLLYGEVVTSTNTLLEKYVVNLLLSYHVGYQILEC